MQAILNTLVNRPFAERAFRIAGLTRGSKDYRELAVGIEEIDRQGKMLVSVREQWIRLLIEFVGFTGVVPRYCRCGQVMLLHPDCCIALCPKCDSLWTINGDNE